MNVGSNRVVVRDIATVMRGTIGAQAIGLAVLPLLSRMFEPRAFGNYQLFVSILTLLLVLTTLRYEVALLRVRGGRQFRALAQLCFILAITMPFAVGLVLAGLGWLGWPSLLLALPFPLWALIAGFLFGGVAQFITVLATREKAFGTLANSKLLQGGMYAGSALGIGSTSAASTGLVVADIAGRAALAVWLTVWSRRTLASVWRFSGWRSIRAVARRYREYPFISTPGTAINVLGGILTPIMIYATFSPAASGQYGLLERSVSLPLGIVVIAVGQVFTAEFSAELRKGPQFAEATFRQFLRYMAMLAVGPLLVLPLGGPWLFTTIFGDEWRLAGELSRLMAPAFGMMLLSGPVHMVLTVMGHQKIQTAWEVARLALVAGLWAAVPRLGISLEAAVSAYSAILVCCNLAFLVLAHLTLRKAARRSAGSQAVCPS